jgi:signal transduction histidine kinase
MASVTYGIRVAVLAAIYVVVAKLGLQMDAVSGFATLVWPATGIALVALLTIGVELWPGVAIGAFVVNVWAGAPIAAAICIAVGNTLEAWIAARALRKLGDTPPALDRVRYVVALVIVGATLSTLICATIGVGGLWLSGAVQHEQVFETWRAWWLGDAIGNLIVAPALLTFMAPRPAALPVRSSFEAAALFLAILASAALVFGKRAPFDLAPFKQGLTMAPVALWAALRFGPRGAAVTTFALAALSVTGTAIGRGPFVRDTLHASLLVLQAFMAMLAIMGMMVGAAVAERARAQAEAAEALRVREDFIAVASHELRTPLASLVLQLKYLQRVMRGGAELDATMLSDRIRRAARQADRLNVLVDNLLDMKRIQAGTLALKREDFDLRDAVREVTDRMNDVAQRARSPIDVHADVPVSGSWDRMYVEQALTNLVANAIKYGGGNPITIDVLVTPSSARVAVTDHGIGISESDSVRIFEPFQRAEATRGYGGLGLGLHIANEVAIAHGGTINVRSTPGQGSTFTLELPRT